MPELTLDELRILTRVRLAPWIGIFWMCLGALLSMVSVPAPGLRGRFAYLYWAFLFVAGLVWFVWTTRRELERSRVLKAQEVRKAGGEKKEGSEK